MCVGGGGGGGPPTDSRRYGVDELMRTETDTHRDVHSSVYEVSVQRWRTSWFSGSSHRNLGRFQPAGDKK